MSHARWWWLGLIVAALVGVGLRWAALDIGRLSDDYMQYAMIEGLYPGGDYAPFDLYAFVREDMDLALHVEQGTAPWFTDPEFHGTVLRPLSSLLLWLDHRLAPGRVRLWHGHSLIWLGLAIVGFGLCARRLLSTWPAALAVVLCVCEAGFVSPVGWLANRCVLVSAVFGFLALYLHLAWRDPEPTTSAFVRRFGPWLEAGAMAACMAGGEYGLGVAAYVLGWELCAGPSGAGEVARARRSWSWRDRALAMIPTAGVVAVYVGLHVGLGYGTFGADVYADPIHAPAGWLDWLGLRMPKLCTGALWSIPASSVTVFYHPGADWWLELDPAADAPGIHRSHAHLGLLGIAIAAAALLVARAGLHEDERRVVRAMLVGGLLGLLPVTVAPSHSRLLVIAQLAACVIVAALIFACGRLLLGQPPARGRDWTWSGRLRGAVLVPVALAMLASHVVGDLVWNRRYLRHLAGMHQQNVLAFTEGDLLEQQLHDREVIVVNGPSQTVGMYGPFLLHSYGAAVPASWRSLALGSHHPTHAYRSDADTLELSAVDGAWLQTAGELFFRRSDRLLAAGDRLEYPTLTIEVVEVIGDGFPTKLRFHFAHDLDDPRYLFLVSTRSGLQTWPVPPVRGRGMIPFARLPVPTGEPAFPQTSSGPK